MGHSIERLKALAVEKLARKPGMYCDGGGLWLRVASPTARSWVFRYMLNRSSHEMGIGKYPEITLAEARQRAAEARRLKAHGKDPLAERDAVRASLLADAAKAVTFKDAAERYIEAHRAGWRNAKHAAQWEATLATYAEPVLGSLPVQTIDTGLVLKVLEPIWAKKTETASRLRGRIEAVLDWAKVRGYRQGENPARWRGHLDKLLPARAKVQKVQHHAALEALFWYRKAAEQGNAGAQANLGLMYERGQGVPQDYAQAHMWLNLAASRAHTAAATKRDEVAAQMTPAQIAEAQKLAREWKPK